jgi:hypothetical protein
VAPLGSEGREGFDIAGAKALHYLGLLAARLKSCPDTKRVDETRSNDSRTNAGVDARTTAGLETGAPFQTGVPFQRYTITRSRY